MPLFTMLYRRYPPKRFRLLCAAFCHFFLLLYTNTFANYEKLKEGCVA